MNFKLKIEKQHDFKKIQERLFELGCKWIQSGHKIIHTSTSGIYVKNNIIIRSLGPDDFSKRDLIEITTEILFDNEKLLPYLI